MIAKQDLLPGEQKSIAKNCQYFMIEAYNYATSHLPVNDPVLQHAQVLQFEQCSSADFSSVTFFNERFPTIQEKLRHCMDKIMTNLLTINAWIKQ